MTEAEIQEGYGRLIELGFAVDTTNPTEAVMAYQSARTDVRGVPLHVDGILGPLTLNALRRDSGAKYEAMPIHLSSSRYASSPFDAIRLRALDVACSQIGNGEEGGNNRGPWVRKYLNGSAPEGSSWCAAFVSWCFLQAHLLHGEMPFPYNLGARRFWNWAQPHDLHARIPNFEIVTAPEPGDLVVWWRGEPTGWQGHVGFVEGFSGGILHTIEGNRTPKIARFSYVVSRIEKLLGFVRIHDVVES